MSGQTKQALLLDTNAVIALLQAEPAVVAAVSGASKVLISIITTIEYTAHSGLSPRDKSFLEAWVQQVIVVPLTVPDDAAVTESAQIRRDTRLKMPDAIIAAAALVSGATLMTRDTDFAKVAGLQTVGF